MRPLDAAQEVHNQERVVFVWLEQPRLCMVLSISQLSLCMVVAVLERRRSVRCARTRAAAPNEADLARAPALSSRRRSGKRFGAPGLASSLFYTTDDSSLHAHSKRNNDGGGAAVGAHEEKKRARGEPPGCAATMVGTQQEAADAPVAWGRGALLPSG